ncbi:MAG: hypothetical protein LQ351_000853 [Letrouitia transgressa]|nr:MAG: hypothetical protein LQ351_000853 [Letrouitia transgressa]
MSTSQEAVEQDKVGSSPPLLNNRSIFVHHAEAVWEQREPYGPPGFRGLFVGYYATLCAAFAALGGMIFGYDQGVVSVVLVMPQFLSRFPRVSDTASGAGFWKGLLTAMIELGALLGALNQGWIADKISRKYSIVIAVIIFTIGSILQTASMDYAMLIVGRLIGGIGIGMLSMVAPLYISEISPPEIRGALLVLEEFSIVAGICIAYWITYGTRFGIVFFPFSPRWLSYKGRDIEALENLAKLRQLPITDRRVEQEWFDIRAEVAFHKETISIRHPNLQAKSKLNSLKLEIVSWTDCFRRGGRRRTHVGMGLMFFQIYYSPSLFKTMGLNYSLQLIMSGVLNLIGGLITPPLVQNTGFGAYTFFAVFCLLSFVWTYIFVPETQGRTLEQMDHVFKDLNGEEDEARRRAIEVEIMSSSQQRAELTVNGVKDREAQVYT